MDELCVVGMHRIILRGLDQSTNTHTHIYAHTLAHK